MNSNSKHWDDIFSKTEDEKMGWYEKYTSQTFNLLQKIPDWENATVFIPGAGISILGGLSPKPRNFPIDVNTIVYIKTRLGSMASMSIVPNDNIAAVSPNKTSLL
ncbi:MAG: hypothetical protein HQK67_08475 [Desulfamplus sp.]|nr:hypothetical protein [Desulfamplus sp.]